MEVLPIVINEHQGAFFKFWFEDKLNEGLRLRNSLFRHVQTFDTTQRDNAYALAYALGQQGIQTVITCSKPYYKVWVDLKVSAPQQSAVEKKSLAIAS